MRPRFAILFGGLVATACAGKHDAALRQTPPPAPVVHTLPGPQGSLTLTRIGHATVLLQSGDTAILADPWFTTTRSFNQGEELAFGISGLPRLTAVINSHGHYDHYDVEALAAYPDLSVPMIVRKDTGADAREAGFTDVRELDWWDTVDVGGVHITATPAKHGVDENTYVLEIGGFVVFFGADSLNIPEFQQVHEKFPEVDLAILSVNGLTLVHEGQVVMNPEDAAKVAGLLSAKVAVPMHYRYHGSWLRETFLYDHTGTPEAFVAAAAKEAPNTTTCVLEPGAPLTLERVPEAATAPNP